MNTEQHTEIKFHRAEGGRKLPFSVAVRAGSTLYLSGQLGIDAEGSVVPGGIAAETRQAMENIRAVLEKYGASLDRVVKVTIMMLDMAEFAEMNQVYVTFFGENLPARSTFGSTGLARGARVEIECIAVVE